MECREIFSDNLFVAFFAVRIDRGGMIKGKKWIFIILYINGGKLSDNYLFVDKPSKYFSRVSSERDDNVWFVVC